MMTMAPPVEKILQKAFHFLEENREKSDMGQPKSEELIQKAEKILGLYFPPSYKEFLKCYGGGGFGSFEVDGILDSENLMAAGSPNMVWCTLNMRQYGFSSNFIRIADVGDGSYYCIDASTTDPNEERPVVWWNGWNATEIEAPTFADFLLKQIEMRLEWEKEEEGGQT